MRRAEANVREAAAPQRGVVPLATARAAELPELGAQAIGLVDAAAAGLALADAVCVSAHATIDPALEREILAACAGMERVIVRASDIGTAMPLRREPDEIVPAGDVAAAVARCRARAAGRGPVAVLLQRWIASDVAGVVFTVDPAGRDDGAVLVEAGWGAPEALGATDSVVVDADTLAIRRRVIRRKPPRGDVPALSDDQAVLLARHALRLRAQSGREHEITWIAKDGLFHVVDVRSLAAPPRRRAPVLDDGAAAESRVLWSRRNIGDMLAGVLSPLGRSLVRFYQHEVHVPCLAAMGVREPGPAAQHYRFVDGRVYANVSLLAHGWARTVAGADPAALARAIAGDDEGAAPPNPYGGRTPAWRRPLAAPSWIAAQAIAIVRAPRQVAALEQAARAERARVEGLALGAMTPLALGVELERRLGTFRSTYVGYLPHMHRAFLLLGVLDELVPAEVARALAAELDLVARDRREAAAIARVAALDPALASVFLRRPDAELERALRATAGGRRFWTSTIAPVLDAHGGRAPCELDLALPRWSEDPRPLLAMIRDALASGDAPPPLLVDPLAGIPRRRRAVVAPLVAAYLRCAELRARTRALVAEAIAAIRGVVLEVARRAVGDGLLYALDEVGDLDLAELRDHLAGRLGRRDVFARSRLEARRVAYLRDVERPDPPETFVGEPAARRRAPALAWRTTLRGTSGSPGVAFGVARVSDDPARAAAELAPGEVLIARSIDGTWIEALRRASAVVLDVGSVLDHGASLSRELNIPAVVDTTSATRTIRTGDRVWVDAEEGCVRVQPRAGRE
jgi:pyruvate,water dikinase